MISRVDFYKLFWERFKQNDIRMGVWLSDADIDKIKVTKSINKNVHNWQAL